MRAFFRIQGCNYFTCLNESCLDPLIAMEIVGHTDYQTTANIYTRLKQETLRKPPSTWRRSLPAALN